MARLIPSTDLLVAGLLALAALSVSAPLRAESEWRPFDDTAKSRSKAAPAAAANATAPFEPGAGAPASNVPAAPPSTRGAYAPAPGSPAARAGTAGAASEAATPFGSTPYGTTPARAAANQSGTPSYGIAPAQGPPPEESARAVERADLSAPLANDGSGLPLDPWQGVDLDKLETRLASLDLPPKSPTLSRLWQRLMTEAAGPQAGKSGDRALAVRAEVLHRSGLIEAEGAALADTEMGAAGEPILKLLWLRSQIGLGERDKGCALARTVMADRAKLPKPLLADAIMLSAYCAVASGSPDAAGLATELIKDAGLKAPNALAALDAMSTGAAVNPAKLDKRITLLDYRYLELVPDFDALVIVDRAEPALVTLLAKSEGLEPRIKLAASEVAARLNLVTPADLARVYQAQAFEPLEMADPTNARLSPPSHRALLYKLAQSERAPLRRTRLIRSLIDDARKAGLYLPMLAIVAPLVDQVPIVPEVGWFSETAIVANLVAGKFAQARAWIGNGASVGSTGLSAGGRDGLSHWYVLIDLAQPGTNTERGEALASAEDFARRGGFSGELLPRLATALDALDYNVPIPLWDAANRAPQAKGGYMPATGVLPELADAARQKHFARTVLAGLAAIGPDGPERTNTLPLGDTVRAFKRAGLEADARRLVVEALLPVWPQSVGN